MELNDFIYNRLSIPFTVYCVIGCRNSFHSLRTSQLVKEFASLTRNAYAIQNAYSFIVNITFKIFIYCASFFLRIHCGVYRKFRETITSPSPGNNGARVLTNSFLCSQAGVASVNPAIRQVMSEASENSTASSAFSRIQCPRTISEPRNENVPTSLVARIMVYGDITSVR
ncbi:hypothetical protein CDAR_273311 [Caerostris darwini]|uniref:Uncharacterized protein n=1 Tax=Caerostris darwini TaxID=1538125 RepID=A0AAV4W551_9ARAC|nr:hypothetical protein CDAR_273311 [Caerostris darwini]